jgi:hypothetical protein
MSTTQRRKVKKRRKMQAEQLEALCALGGIKVIYTRPNHVRLFWAENDMIDRWIVPDLGPECLVGKTAFERMDNLLKLRRR